MICLVGILIHGRSFGKVEVVNILHRNDIVIS